MKLIITPSRQELGQAAAKLIAAKINAAIKARGCARIVLSTGASQFETIEALIKEDIDWSRVTMFHLDEYIGLPETHIASFRKYLKERFVSKVPLGRAFFVNGEGDVHANIKELTAALTEAPIDIGVIGIGENGHIAFNDPPADFNTRASYMAVKLDDQCKAQQVGEGWFPDLAAVPEQAITMTPYRILQCQCIVSSVPGKVKAQAIFNMLNTQLPDSMFPATLLKDHKDYTLVLDSESASLLTDEMKNIG